MKFMKIWASYETRDPYAAVLAAQMWDHREYRGRRLTKREAARLLGWDRNTVRKRWKKARAMCNDAWNVLEDERAMREAKQARRNPKMRIHRG